MNTPTATSTRPLYSGSPYEPDGLNIGIAVFFCLFAVAIGFSWWCKKHGIPCLERKMDDGAVLPGEVRRCQKSVEWSEHDVYQAAGLYRPKVIPRRMSSFAEDVRVPMPGVLPKSATPGLSVPEEADITTELPTTDALTLLEEGRSTSSVDEKTVLPSFSSVDLADMLPRYVESSPKVYVPGKPLKEESVWLSTRKVESPEDQSVRGKFHQVVFPKRAI